MKLVCEKFNFAGANVFTGEPLTASKGPWFVRDPAFQVNITRACAWSDFVPCLLIDVSLRTFFTNKRE